MSNGSIQAMSKNNVQYIDVTLQDGLEIDGAFTTKVSFRKPKVKDLLLVEQNSKSKTDGQANLLLLANLTDLSTTQLEEMTALDYRILNEAIAPFMGVE